MNSGILIPVKIEERREPKSILNLDENIRKIARHLPTPYLKDKQPIILSITQFVLEKFEEDEHLFKEFCYGIHNNVTFYFGDILEKHCHEAEVVKQFFNHPSKRIRDWAKMEFEIATKSAKKWQQIHKNNYQTNFYQEMNS